MNPILRLLCCGLVLAAPVAAAAQSAPPTLSNPPVVAPQAKPATTAPAAAPVGATAATDDYLLGRSYRVETMQGTSFTGTLVSMSLTSLEFDAQELGRITLERGQIRRAELQGPVAVGVSGAKPGYFDIGNGSRLFFAPTGRGLRRGENTLQTVNLFLLGVNFGITDNFSLGGYVSIVPGASPFNQFLLLTPKVNFPIREKLNVGAGLLYVRVPDFDSNGNSRRTGAGIGYGALTFGGADSNFTVGLGYGFVSGKIGSTPVMLLGGQTRVSRRISLVSENYIIADSEAGMAGLYGIKVNWRRTSLGLGALYAIKYNSRDYYSGGPNSGASNTGGPSGFTTYILPVYYDFTFRFGKGVK